MEMQKKESIPVRGRKFTGNVTSTKMARTAVLVLERRIYNTKYERYEKRNTRIKAHIPDGMHVDEGDKVSVQETRPISKTKHFMVIKNLTKDNENGNEKVEKETSTPKKSTKKA